MIKHKIIITFLIISLFSEQFIAQKAFNRNDDIVVLKNNGDTLKKAWAGGFNSAQFSEIDLNLDGKKDLFVFDRAGNQIFPFINIGTANESNYKHAPQYINDFPDLHHWVILRDYNCDNKMDIFTYGNAGIAIYKNTSTTSLSFELQTSLLHSQYLSNYLNIFVSSADLPAIDDIDNDGDLDILTFSILGSYVEYHKNLSIETYGTCDSLNYELRNNCWGFFREGASNVVVLDDTCSGNIANPERRRVENKHSGSTLLTLDADGNNTKDLILGDISFNNFTILYNGDTSSNFTSSHITSQDTAYPANNSSTTPVDLDVFPAGYYLDVNNDNVKDLIATNNNRNSKNYNNVWMYQNNNTTNNADFSLITTSFLQDEMIETGERSFPAFFDYNADGLMDIIIGNYGIYDTSSTTNYYSSLWLFENIGTVSSPAFQLIDSNYANVSNLNLDISNNRPTLGLAPTFGDIDNDGDQDYDHRRLHWFSSLF